MNKMQVETSVECGDCRSRTTEAQVQSHSEYVGQVSNDCQTIPKQEIQVCRDMTPCRWVSRIVVASFSGSSSTSSMGQGQGHSIKSRPCVQQLATFEFQGRLRARRKLWGNQITAVRQQRPASLMHNKHSDVSTQSRRRTLDDATPTRSTVSCR